MSQNMITAPRAQPELISTGLYNPEVEQVSWKNVLPPERAVSVGLKCDDSVCKGRVS